MGFPVGIKLSFSLVDMSICVQSKKEVALFVDLGIRKVTTMLGPVFLLKLDGAVFGIHRVQKTSRLVIPQIQ